MGMFLYDPLNNYHPVSLHMILVDNAQVDDSSSNLLFTWINFNPNVDK